MNEEINGMKKNKIKNEGKRGETTNIFVNLKYFYSLAELPALEGIELPD